MKYIKGLDGLRAIAVLLVIVSHWFAFVPFIHGMLLGKTGVDVFFVISGFLITKILFHNRIAIKEKGISIFKSLSVFIGKRTVRIFPVYYLLVLFLYLTNGDEFRDGIVYYLTYTSNYYFYNTQSWHGFVGHFWSLAVEEQFYLFWPLFMFFIKQRYLFLFLLFTIVLGSAYPYFLSQSMTSILTLSCVNAFAIGALLSYVLVYKPSYTQLFYKFLKVLTYPLVVVFLLQLFGMKISYYPHRLIVSLLTLRLILLCVEAPNTYIFKFLNIKVLRFIGKISYGIYLYHNFIPSYWNGIFRVNQIEQPQLLQGGFKYIVYFVLLLLISYASWILIEQPFLKLKKHLTNE